MQDACAGVISLFFMLRSLQQTVDELRHLRAEHRSPAPIISAILLVDFLVVKVFWLHMAVICDIKRELRVRPLMCADQPVVLIADPDLGRRCLQNCWLSTIRIEYGVVVAVILDVVIIRDCSDRFIIAYRVSSAWQWFHARFVVLTERVHP